MNFLDLLDGAEYLAQQGNPQIAGLDYDSRRVRPGWCFVAMRGLVYTELEARAAAHDLHSGQYGGAAPNPMQALAEMIGKLKGPDGKILIPGFYKRVKKPTAQELASWKKLPFNEKNFMKKEIGTTALVGEKGFSVLERLCPRALLGDPAGRLSAHG